jgi:hypothetical protein
MQIMKVFPLIVAVVAIALSVHLSAQSLPPSPTTRQSSPTSPPPPTTQPTDYWYFVSTGEPISGIVNRLLPSVAPRPKETNDGRRTRIVNTIALLNPHLSLGSSVSSTVGAGRLVVVPDAAAIDRTSSSQLAFHWITCRQLSKLNEIVPFADREVSDLIKNLQAQDHYAPQHSTLFHVMVFPSLLTESHVYYLPNLPDGIVTDRVIGSEMRRKVRQLIAGRYDYLLGLID